MTHRVRGPRTAATAVILAALGVLVLGTPAAQAAQPVPDGFVGMMVDGPLYPVTSPGVNLGAQFDKMVASGVESVRAVFDWSNAQPYRTWRQVPPAELDQFTDVNGVPTRFGETDQLVAAAAAHGVTVMPVVLYTPGWDAAPHPSRDFAIPQSPKPYASFVAALVRRYGPGGSFWETNSPALPIRMWQIWNEPNISTFWPTHPYQRGYVKLLHAAHDAIKAIDPGAKVVLAGLPNYSWVQLGRIYKVRHASKWFDVAAIHPYTKTPKGVIEILDKARQAMDDAGDKQTPIVADEISWPSSLGKTDHTVGFDFATTEAGQAHKLARLLPLLGENRARLRLLGFYYYTWATTPDPDGLAFTYAGLENYDASTGEFAAKPALSAFSNAALALEDCHEKGSVATACAER
jgi:hypothetical protein